MARLGANVLPGGASFAIALGTLLLSCGQTGEPAPLSKSEDDGAAIRFNPPPEKGPKLGAIANATPVLERPSANARSIGALHAGAFVTRSDAPVRKTASCEGGYYAVHPRGVVCLNQGASLDAAHPTLQAMAIRPSLDKALPYTYGRTRTETGLLERDPERSDAVRELRKLARGSTMAIVGSWSARIGDSEPERLGLLTDGHFVRAADLEMLKSTSFAGEELSGEQELPVAFVVKRGVSQFKSDGDDAYVKAEPLEYHQVVRLSGRFRTQKGTKLWAAENDRFVRDQDVTVIQRRTKFPDFVQDGQRWLDVGVILGTLVAYEGKKAVFATLVSTGRDRLGDSAVAEQTPAVTKLGTFEVLVKHITLLSAPAERAGERFGVFDVPWVQELSSGQLLLGAYWHDRFGIEHGPGDIGLSPTDAQRIFAWSTPALPKSWHSATSVDSDKTIVHVRK